MYYVQKCIRLTHVNFQAVIWVLTQGVYKIDLLYSLDPMDLKQKAIIKERIGVLQRIYLRWPMSFSNQSGEVQHPYPNSKVHGANVGPTWGRQDPGGPHVGHINFAIWVVYFESAL